MQPPHHGFHAHRTHENFFELVGQLFRVLAAFLLSLVGIPPFVGFMGKLYVFAAVVERGSSYAWFAVVGALNAAIGAFYYFRVLKTMTIDAEETEKPPLVLAPADLTWVGLFAVANLVPIFFWGSVEAWARQSLTLWAGP